MHNGDVSHRDAVEDRPDLDGLAIDPRQAGQVGALYGCLSQHGGHEKTCQFGVEKHTGKWPLETGI